MNESLLPVGAVVKILNTNVLIMIIGHYPVDSESNRIYHYLGVVYPTGINDEDDMVMFDKSILEKIVYSGVLYDDGKEFYNNYMTMMDNESFVEQILLD